MRDIKFRRWEGFNDVMRYDNDNTTVHGLNWAQWCHPDNVREFTYMQYTGLKDKNGKEIYEGDIVKVFYDSTNYYGERSQNFSIEKVEWGIYYDDEYDRTIECWIIGNDSLSSEVTRIAKQKVDKPSGYGKAVFHELYLEVIGNIYENPELLEVEK